MIQYKNTVETIQNTVNTSTHITKTPTQLSQNPHIHTPTHYTTS
jgi:CRISPR/Cas system endoribonuclease Cas6 (RAMP superfamily)